MTTIFASYEEQFDTIIASVANRLGSVHTSHGVEKKTVISNIERQLDEAQELLEQMVLEVRELPNSDRAKATSSVKGYQTKYSKLEAELKKHKMNDSSRMREELLEYDDSALTDPRTRLLDNTERLERSTKRLEAGYRIAVETEKLGQDVLDNLQRDRETITRTRGRLREGDDNLGRSSRILSTMTRRIIQNRLISLGVMVVMLVVIIIVIYIIATRPG